MLTREEICCRVNKIAHFATGKGVPVNEYITDLVLPHCVTPGLKQAFVDAGKVVLPQLKEKKYKRSAAHLEKAIKEVSDILKFQSERTGKSQRQRKTRRLLKARVLKGSLRLLAHPQVGQ